MRWRLAGLVAAVALAAVLAGCGSSGAGGGNGPANYGTRITGKLPASGRPARGGTISVGQLAGQTPAEILPIIDAHSCGTATVNFVEDQYIPLYAGPDGAEPATDERLSAALPPKYSDHDTVVTIKLKPGLRWSDGKPVDAQDVIFDLDLLKAALGASAQNWCQYTAGEFPDDVTSWTASGTDTVVLHLERSVNPSWFTANQLQDEGEGIYPLPSQDWDVDSAGGAHITDWATNPADALKIYDYLHAQGEDPATFASNPLWRVVDGPFALEGFSAADGAFNLVPNRGYGLRPRSRVREVMVRTYADAAAMLRAMRSRSLDIGTLEPGKQLWAIRGLRRRGYSVFGGPGWGWFGAVINFRDTTDDFDKVVAQTYIRGALAELVDQAAMVSRVYRGWAVAAYGPVPAAVRSPFLSAAATTAAWPYDPARAVATLKAHGWKVRAGGQTTCARPGAKADECGAGIPAGTPIRFVWAEAPAQVSPAAAHESQIFAAEARRAAGIDVTLVSRPFSFLVADYNDQNPAAAGYVDAWGVNDYGGVGDQYYPTLDGLMTADGGLNIGAYDDSRAQRLMAASVASASPGAIGREVAYMSRDYPVLYLPDQDSIAAVSSRIGGARQGFLAMTQQQYQLQFLYVVRRR